MMYKSNYKNFFPKEKSVIVDKKKIDKTHGLVY